MPLTLGTRLGPYEIAGSLGAGGMGEVYRASDTNLGRDVAIKVLPEAFATDPDRLARFEREARALAALNHPNIAQIYGVERAQATYALVMELVPGLDLSQRLASGPLPLTEALPVARQIAVALEAAHDAGFVHRDLKPANVKVKDDGTVKLLDFGLAKAMDPTGGTSAADVTNSPTLTARATQLGVILGTAAYMSPEQARGKAVDKRTDVWAFGCVLYEMLAGRRLFSSDDVSDTLAFVLTKEPDWSALPADTPVAIRRLLRRCLTKDRAARLPDIGSARLEIDEALSAPPAAVTSGDAMAPASPRPRRRTTVVAATLGIVLLTALAVWLGMGATRSAESLVTRSIINVAPASRLLSGYALDPSLGLGRPSRTAVALSPDGRLLAFTAERDGRVQLYLRQLDELEATVVPGTEGASGPFFSPDGQAVGFYADGALKRVPVAGGPVVSICNTALVYGASWGRTGSIVFAHAYTSLWQVPATGGTPAPLTALDEEAGELGHRLPQILPDGSTVLFTVIKTPFPSWDETEVVAQSLTTGARTVLVDGGADARYSAAGLLVYLRRGTLMAAAFDVNRLEVGDAVGVVDGVMQAVGTQPFQLDGGAGQFAVANDGSLVYARGGIFPQDRWAVGWRDRSGGRDPLRLEPGGWISPRLSPDETRIALASTTGDWDVYVYDLERGGVTRLRMDGEQASPVWTRDGLRVTFSGAAGGSRRTLFSRSADGAGATEVLATSHFVYAHDWTPDGSTLAFGGGSSGLWLLRSGEKEPRVLVAESGLAQTAFSPDGKWVAYNSGVTSGSAQRHVYLQPYPGPGQRRLVSGTNGSSPVWRQDGRELYYLEVVSGEELRRLRVVAVEIRTSPDLWVGPARPLFEGAFRNDGPFRAFDVTPNGQRFLMVEEIERPPAHITEIVLVQNWQEELKRLVRQN